MRAFHAALGLALLASPAMAAENRAAADSTALSSARGLEAQQAYMGCWAYWYSASEGAQGSNFERLISVDRACVDRFVAFARTAGLENAVATRAYFGQIYRIGLDN